VASAVVERTAQTGDVEVWIIIQSMLSDEFFLFRCLYTCRLL